MIKFNVYNGGVKLYFGLNTINNASKYLTGFKKLLIVTGKKSAKISGALDDILKILDEKGIEYSIYNEIRPNPVTDNVRGLVEKYNAEEAEGFIAIGGGSIIDAVKAARAVISGGGDIVEYLEGKRHIPVNQPFLLAINLTHGTGTEIDRYAVVTIPETKEKIGFAPGYPTVSIDDPRYTVTLPRNQTIYTSIDAFAHAVESATSVYASPYTYLLAAESVKYIVAYLPRALKNPSDIEARYWLLYASMIAGISIDHGVTHLGHGLEHILSGYNPDLPHGAGLAILYKGLMRYFYELNPEVMCKILKPLDPTLRPRKEDAEKAQEAYNLFLESIGYKETLSTYGFDEDIIRELVKNFYELPKMKKYHLLSPRIPSMEEIYKIMSSLI